MSTLGELVYRSDSTGKEPLDFERFMPIPKDSADEDDDDEPARPVQSPEQAAAAFASCGVVVVYGNGRSPSSEAQA